MSPPPPRPRRVAVSSAGARRLLRAVRLIVFDFDGVFTDNHVWVDGNCQIVDGVMQNTALSALDTRTKLWQNRLKTGAAS